MVHDLTAGKELYSYQADKLYRPASIEKVVTAVTALDVLGKDFQFQTTLSYDGVVEKGILKGNLYVKGGFEPGVYGVGYGLSGQSRERGRHTSYLRKNLWVMFL